MKILKILSKNALRHKLRTSLTIIGIAIAVLAFALLRSVVGAWYAGVEAASADRLIVRHAVSFVFPLPYSYYEKIRRVPGVANLSYAVWFQGIYKDQSFKNFFPRMAIDPEHYFEIYPEFIVPPDQFEAFKKERNAVVLGIKTARQHGIKIGDVIPIEGDIYPGRWEFVVRAIYHGRDRLADETAMFFDWKYLDESIQRSTPGRAGNVGWYVLETQKGVNGAVIASTIDGLFKNSPAETKTETERAFNQSFVSMYSAIISAMNVISFVIIGIIFLVLANTMAMTARERLGEFAILKTLGFTGKHVGLIIAGESLLIACIGGILGLAASYPARLAFQNAFPNLFPLLPGFALIAVIGFAAALLVGLLSSVGPVFRASRMTIVEGLRHLG